MAIDKSHAGMTTMTSSSFTHFRQKLRSAKEQFLLDGYAVVSNLWSKPDIDRTLDALEMVLRSILANLEDWKQYVILQRDIPVSQLDGIPESRRRKAAEQIYIVSDIARHHRDLRSMILSPVCMAVARHLLGENIVCHFSNFTGRAAEVGASCQCHRDWPNSFCSTRDGFQIRLMICLDGMENGQGITRVIPGSHHWDDARFKSWKLDNPPLATAGKSLRCPPGSLIVLGPTIVHGAEGNRSMKPRRNLIAQSGRRRDAICIESAESLTGHAPGMKLPR